MNRNIKFGEWYTFKKEDSKTAVITGYDPSQTVGVGSRVLGNSNNPVSGIVTEVLERRNHSGVFVNHENSVNSFFRARVELSE